MYRLTQVWPKDELYGLTSQARRATSVPANNAEGNGRENSGSYVQFRRIAQGSIKELETHLLVAQRVGIAGSEGMEPPLIQGEIMGKMLRCLIRKLAAE